jgi:hypothetical protein
MRVWVLCTGEPIPFLAAESGDRFLRAGRLAGYLTERGHEVIWWTARFDHFTKTHRDIESNKVLDLGVNAPKMVFLESVGYQNNISLRRFMDHWQIGRAFRNLSAQLEKPDVIISSFPLVELCDEAVEFGKKNNVPVILDIRDLWPDALYERLQQKIGISGQGLFFPYERLCRRTFHNADRVIGITHGIQNWCYDRFGRPEQYKSVDKFIRQFKDRPQDHREDQEDFR